MSHKLVSLYIGDGEYYTQTDADNLIAELKKQVHECTQGRSSAEKELRHQKYKRCLAMARWSFTKSNYHFGLARHGEDAKKNTRKSILYTKWNKRWLAIAEKFKEGVNAVDKSNA